MAAALIHPNWDKPPLGITDGFSLEMTAKDEASLRDAAHLIPADTPIAVTFLPGEDVAARFKKEAGFTYVAMDLAGYRRGSMNEKPAQPTAAQCRPFRPAALAHPAAFPYRGGAAFPHAPLRD